MPRAKKPTPNQPPELLPDDDVFHAVLYVSDRDTLAKLLSKQQLDIGPTHVDPDTKALEVVVYVTEPQRARLEEAGWKIDVRENMSEIGRQRQHEVGQGDRFAGGSIPPKGLGKKTENEQ